MRLSKAQVNLLRILRDEDTTVRILRAVRGGPNTFISNRIGQGRSPRFDTVLNLERLGLLEDITDEKMRWRGSEYRITEAGMEAIREAA